MSLSDEEQDDNTVYDKLKSIKAFTVEQLYLLHPDVGCPTTQPASIPPVNSNSSTLHDPDLYQNLVEHEQLRNKLNRLELQVKHLNKKTVEHVDKVWVFEEKIQRMIGVCQQAKIAETTFKYKQASINAKKLDVLLTSFAELSETISKDYIYYSFESQLKRHRIATHLSIAYQNSDLIERPKKLRLCIATLIDFIKHLGDSKIDFVLQCRKWLRALIKRFLENESTEDHRFVISQLCKGPAGIADWSADLIERKPFEQISAFESAPQYITHCSALLTELFNNLKRMRRVTISPGENLDSPRNFDNLDQNWSLLDPRFKCSEEFNLTSTPGNTLSESDVIKFCQRIPVAQIFRAYVKRCLEFNDFRPEADKNYERIMLELLTLGTIIIRTYQAGLETFNSIQYGDLIEYLSSQLRRTVIVLSDQWTEFKLRLKRVDNALMMRLQVEYDNFILRSILIILELRQSGIWRHLSQLEQEDAQPNYPNSNSWSAESFKPALTKLFKATGITSSASSQAIENEYIQNSSPSKSSSSLTYEFSIEWFKEVSEPMLWHILWQFYHNAFVNSCDYHSDNYWLEKFREKSVIYLFVNKIRDSPPGECSYLLNSITNMLLSRDRQDSKLVSFIATEIFNLSYKQEEMKCKITKKGTKSLIRAAEKFPNLVSLFIDYMVNEELLEDVVELFKGCSLSGWICSDEELEIIATWLIEYPLDSSHNKVARLLISKILLNSPHSRSTQDDMPNPVLHKRIPKSSNCFVDLKLRRKLALLLYEATIHHLPDNNEYSPKSLGASVEVAFGSVFCERAVTLKDILIEIATDTNYHQLYVWVWRLLFTFRLHILNQSETDWNDVQSRSGTSRSIKNTVIFNDFFHPVPSIQDSECSSLSEGVKNMNPVAVFIYSMMTDVTWQAETLLSCLSYLNSMAQSGHLTPSMMLMKFLTICHLNYLSSTTVKDPSLLEYFKIVIASDFDATRIASLIICQMQHLKQYRQLQLSHFYISILLELASSILRQISTSWFSGEEHTLEKIACLLDNIIRFNFTTQRVEIIRKFYDCSYATQACKTTNSWIGSFFTSNSLNADSTRREFLTILHVLTQKFKKFTWLRWVTTECDTLRLEKIWENIVAYLSTNESATLDSAIKKVCPQINPSILKTTLPIYSWLNQIFDIVESDLSHPLCPLIWYNFFLNYFSNSLNGVSVGLKLISQETQSKLLTRLDSLFNYHLYKHRNWASTSTLQQNSLAQLYKAYRLWLHNRTLQDAYVDIDRLKGDYLVPLLKAVMESTTDSACLKYIDIASIEIQNKNLCQIWLSATHLGGNHLIKQMKFVLTDQNDSMELLTSVDDEADDAVSLIVKPNNVSTEYNRSLESSEEELTAPLSELNEDGYQDADEVILVIKRNLQIVFEESSIFKSSITALDGMKVEIVDLMKQLYSNRKRNLIRSVPCAEGVECIGPAKIELEIEEATIDDRISGCVHDRQRQCEILIGELLSMPCSRTVQSSILIERKVNQLSKDTYKAGFIIETLLNWISEPDVYSQLNGSFYASNYLLKIILEILSNTNETDTYTSTLMSVCFQHPGSVQIFSPHLTPSLCSPECFLELYRKISAQHENIGPMAMFVLLSKFDINSWLKNTNDRNMLREAIKTTCSGFRKMGKEPDENFILTFDLYRHHLQVELAPPDRKRPEEISVVLMEFLTIMDEQSLAPSLWGEFMSIIGLEKQVSLQEIDARNRVRANANKSGLLQDKNSISDSLYIPATNLIDERDDSSVINVIQDIARLSDSQIVFDHNSINDIMKTIIEFIKEKHENIDITLIELYQDYLEQFGVLLLSVTFIWLKITSEKYPDNHELIWEQFKQLWDHWVFLSKNCQNVRKSDYCLMATYYVAALRYMIFKLTDNTQLILQSTLSTLAHYVTVTKEVVYLELTILQRSLKELPWSSLIATSTDLDNLATLSEQENYNISDLVSHILLQIDVKRSLEAIHSNEPASMPHVTERLATTIVLQSAYLKAFRLHGYFFYLIPADCVSKLATLILPRMEFVNLEHSQTNKLLVNLLRFMCIKLDSISDSAQLDSTDNFKRSIIYGQFVSNYLVDLIKNHPAVVTYHKSYLDAVMDNSLQDLKMLISPDVNISKKIAIYTSLLESCSSSQIDQESRLLIAKALINSTLLKNRPIVTMEIFQAIGQIISDGRVLVYTIENMIDLYLNMNGHYEKVWKSFHLTALPSDLYLGACIEENAPLALLVYFEALLRNGQDSQYIAGHNAGEHYINNNKIWSSFFHWLSQLSVVTSVDSSNKSKSNDTKLTVTWLRMIDLLELNLLQFMRQVKANSSITSDLDRVSSKSIDSKSTHDGPEIKSDQQETNQTSPPLSLSADHKSLLNFLKALIAMYDSYNSGGLWSYLRSTRTEETSRASIIALAIACFISDKSLTCITNSAQASESGLSDDSAAQNNEQRSKQTSVPPYLSLVNDEIAKLRKDCLSKLEVARKAKYYVDSAPFIEALIESVNRNDKVQYSDGVQLMTTFVKSIHSNANSMDYTCISKILL